MLEKYRKLSITAKASVWYIICYIIQRGIQFIGMPIFTRIMSEEQYGEYSVFLSWFSVVCIFTSLNVYANTFNKAMIKYENKRNAFISSAQTLTTLTTFLFAVAIFVFRRKLCTLLGVDMIWLVLFFVNLFLFPSLQYWSQEQRFKFEYKAMLLVTLLNSVCTLVLGVIFVVLSEEKGTALIFSTVLVQGIICIVLYLNIANKGKVYFDSEMWGWTLGVALPLIPHYLSEVVLGHADRLMINSMVGSAYAGIYNIVYQLSMVMAIIRQGINGAFIPWEYYAIKEKKFDEIKNVTKILTLVMGVLTVFVMLLGPEILKIITPPSYHEALIDIPPIMIGGFLMFIYLMFINIEVYYEKNKYVSIATVVAAVLNIILNYISIKKFGYLAAGYTTMLSYGVMVLLHWRFLKKIDEEYEDVSRIYDIKFMFSSIIVVVILGAIILFLYDYWVIRYIIVLLIIIIAIVKNKSIVIVFKNFKQRK